MSFQLCLAHLKGFCSLSEFAKAISLTHEVLLRCFSVISCFSFFRVIPVSEYNHTMKTLRADSDFKFSEEYEVAIFVFCFDTVVHLLQMM